jgi:transposase InsO family protein
VQFTSWAFTDRVKPSGLVPSMGSIGDYDNAVIESFWGRMQTDLLDGGTVISPTHYYFFIINYVASQIACHIAIV